MYRIEKGEKEKENGKWVKSEEMKQSWVDTLGDKLKGTPSTKGGWGNWESARREMKRRRDGECGRTVDRYQQDTGTEYLIGIGWPQNISRQLATVYLFSRNTSVRCVGPCTLFDKKSFHFPSSIFSAEISRSWILNIFRPEDNIFFFSSFSFIFFSIQILLSLSLSRSFLSRDRIFIPLSNIWIRSSSRRFTFTVLISFQDIETFDLEDFKYNSVNMTAFRLVDVEEPKVAEVLRQMERFQPVGHTILNKTGVIQVRWLPNSYEGNIHTE